ncbi:MAG: DNA internalization-related competence protein ComEC/Rec2 [Oleiphilus sp.]
MFKSILGFISGVILLYFSGDLINSSQETLNYCRVLQKTLILLTISLLIGLVFTRSSLASRAFLFFISMLFGFSYALSQADAFLKVKQSLELDNTLIHISGFLCSLPKRNQFSDSAKFCLLEVHDASGLPLKGKGFYANLTWSPDIELDRGVQRLLVKSKRTKAAFNFEGQNYETVSFYDRILFVGRVEALEGVAGLDSLSFINKIIYQYHQTRHYISTYLDSLLENTLHKGVIRALLLGDKAQLSMTEYQTLGNTGTQHLIAISGLHVGLVMLGLYCLLKKSFSSVVIISVLGFAYILLVGFAPSAQRAWVMSICALFVLTGLIRKQAWPTFFMAMFLVLLLDPLATFTMGFWFSFLCVAAILMLLQALPIQYKHPASLIFIQVFLLIFMLPINSHLGLKAGLENMLANAFAVPWVTLLVLPFVFFWFLVSLLSDTLAGFVLPLLDGSIEVLFAFLSSLEIIQLPQAVAVDSLLILCFYALIFLSVIFTRFATLSVPSMLGLALLMNFSSKFYSDDFEFTVFDVGQGLAISVRAQGQIWLYDLGPAYAKSSSTSQVVLPYLRQHRKSNQLSGVVVSHGDADHAGDIQALLQEFVPKLAWSGESDRLASQLFRPCEQGDEWQGEGFKVSVLYPFKATKQNTLSANNQSCIVRISAGGKVFLLMGDVDDQIELDLVKHYRDGLKADVLIASHHGASRGSSYALLKHVKPDYIVFSAGYLNKFGHPAKDVTRRAKHLELVALNTAELGAIRFTFYPQAGNLQAEFARY